jgi:hypothetical protein
VLTLLIALLTVLISGGSATYRRADK